MGFSADTKASPFPRQRVAFLPAAPSGSGSSCIVHRLAGPAGDGRLRVDREAAAFMLADQSVRITVWRYRVLGTQPVAQRLKLLMSSNQLDIRPTTAAFAHATLYVPALALQHFGGSSSSRSPTSPKSPLNRPVCPVGEPESEGFGSPPITAAIIEELDRADSIMKCNTFRKVLCWHGNKLKTSEQCGTNVDSIES